MPVTTLLLYREADGSVPLIEWLDTLPDRARVKCLARISRLADLGHELRRPEVDLLTDGIYELRIRLGTSNYRIIYFFVGRHAVVLSHGLVKERQVPPIEIARAIHRREAFNRNPSLHTAREHLT